MAAMVKGEQNETIRQTPGKALQATIGDVNPNYLVSPMAALRDRGDIAYDQELAGLYADYAGFARRGAAR